MSNVTPKRSGVIKSAVGDVRRLREIAGVLSKHGFRQASRALGFGTAVDESRSEVDVDNREHLAIRARAVLEDLGPTFIKLGQILSTRPDILPPVFITELEKLQDSAPSVGVDDIRKVIEDSLGKPIDALFASFEEDEIATASIAQVHRATLFDGTEVVVKVQRPGIAPQIKSDLALLYYLARFGEATVDEIGLYNPVAIVKEFENAITQELNFLIEARNNERARKNAQDDPAILIPRVIEDFSTARVITQTFVDGRKLSTIEVGSERAKKLTSIAMEAAFQQIFRDGFFHGDPHPGNMMITDDDRVVFIDWGLVGHLSSAQQGELVDLIIAIIVNDADGIARLLLRMGVPDSRVNLRRLRAAIQNIRDRHLTQRLDELDLASMMQDIMELTHEHRIRVNPEYALTTKATATVEGVLRSVYPDLDILETLRPYAERLLTERYSGEALVRGSLVTLMRVNHVIRDLPLQLDQVLMDVESGQLQVQITNEALDQHTASMTILGSRIFMGFLAAGLIVGGTILLSTQTWTVYEVPVLAVLGALFFVIAGFVAFAAMAWHFVTGGIRKLRLTPWVRLLRRK